MLYIKNHQIAFNKNQKRHKFFVALDGDGGGAQMN